MKKAPNLYPNKKGGGGQGDDPLLTFPLHSRFMVGISNKPYITRIAGSDSTDYDSADHENKLIEEGGDWFPPPDRRGTRAHPRENFSHLKRAFS